MVELRRRQRQQTPTSTNDQRSLNDAGTQPPPSRRSTGASSLPSARVLLVTFLLFHAVVLTTVAHFHTWLPPPQPLEAPQNEFSEARARVVLEQIMSFGYRPVGSKANDELTPAYLLSEIEKIKAAAPLGVTIEIDVQKPTGAFGLNFLAQFQNIYANVTNIVVRLATTARPDDDTNVLENSLMLSSHYDAAFGAAAASDDGVNIAIMMELLRYFAHEPPTHGSLIFNFNGAEETILQAAHGFITQHKWTKHIRAFINLEAAGAGGRELLFQTSSDELALAYAEGAKYPHASIIGQELFQTGVIPADTDFRVYRDFGAIAGMDFAYIANGYVYHTMLDDVSRIQPGAVQRLGENIVGVVQRLANEPGRLAKIASTPHSSNTLFFDVAGVFMVSMGKSMAYRICGGIAAVAVVYLMVSPITLRERVAAFKLLWQCMGAAFVASLCMALVLTLFAPLSWYTMPYLGGVTFVAPALAGMVDRLAQFLHHKQVKTTKPSSEMLWRIERSLFEATLVTWLLAMGGLLSKNLLSSYVMGVWIVFPLAGHILCRVLQRAKLLSPTVYIGLSLAAVAVPVAHSASILGIAFMFFTPLLGRSGTLVPPDLVMAVVFVLSAGVILSYSSRFFCFVSPTKLLVLRNGLVAISLGSLLLSTIVNPYSIITPKRLMVQHVHRDVRLRNGSIVSQDSGIWLNAVDFRGLASIKPFLAETQWQHAPLVPPPQALVDKLGLYGDMPFGKPIRDMLPERHSWYLPTVPPVFTATETVPDLEVLSSKYDAMTNRRTVHVLFTGPAHLDIFIDATKTTLTSWSIGEGVNGPAPHKNGTYILQFATGTPPAAFHFWLEAETDHAIELSIVGHHLEKVTPQMRELAHAMPAWSHSVGFVSTWSMRSI